MRPHRQFVLAFASVAALFAAGLPMLTDGGVVVAVGGAALVLGGLAGTVWLGRLVVLAERRRSAR